jgi:hypothetical protein
MVSLRQLFFLIRISYIYLMVDSPLEEAAGIQFSKAASLGCHRPLRLMLQCTTS